MCPEDETYIALVRPTLLEMYEKLITWRRNIGYVSIARANMFFQSNHWDPDAFKRELDEYKRKIRESKNIDT